MTDTTSPIEEKTHYALGEACWIYVGTHEGMSEQVSGHVIATFPHNLVRYYIIQLDDQDWTHFEVRDATLMSPVENVSPRYFTAGKLAPPRAHDNRH